MSELNCTRCRQVIGVYEPLITLSEGRPRESSRAAEADALSRGESGYHRSCFEQLHGKLEEQ